MPRELSAIAEVVKKGRLFAQTNNRLVTYLLVGVLNTVFGYSVFAALLFIHCHYTLAVLLSTVLGVLFNFKTIGKLVFKSHDNRLIFRFVSVYVVTYLLNISGLRLYKIFDDNMYLAGFLMLIPSTMVSFTLHKLFVFRGKRN